MAMAFMPHAIAMARVARVWLCAYVLSHSFAHMGMWVDGLGRIYCPMGLGPLWPSMTPRGPPVAAYATMHLCLYGSIMLWPYVPMACGPIALRPYGLLTHAHGHLDPSWLCAMARSSRTGSFVATGIKFRSSYALDSGQCPGSLRRAQ